MPVIPFSPLLSSPLLSSPLLSSPLLSSPLPLLSSLLPLFLFYWSKELFHSNSFISSPLTNRHSFIFLSPSHLPLLSGLLWNRALTAAWPSKRVIIESLCSYTEKRSLYLGFGSSINVKVGGPALVHPHPSAGGEDQTRWGISSPCMDVCVLTIVSKWTLHTKPFYIW